MKNDRKFELILYPDSIVYDCDVVIKKATEYFDEWAYILHDKDVNEDGTSKKPHYHFYGRSCKTLTPKGIAFNLNIPENSIQNVKRWKSSIRYLIHYDDSDKYQYDIQSIFSNIQLDNYFSSVLSDDKQAEIIFDYIYKYHPTVDGATEYCIKNGLWSAFRRGFAVWCKVIGGYSYESDRNKKV